MDESDLVVEQTTTTAVAALVAESWSDSYGLTSPSVYETGRLVTLAPWLAGHTWRVRFLLERQHADGSWGGWDGYGLIPTLSATEALLTSLRRDRLPDPAGVVRAADRGLRVLFGWLDSGGGPPLPDTVAIELLIPALITDINLGLDRLEAEPVAGLDSWRGAARLTLPDGVHDDTLLRLRDAVDRGHGLPDKVLHSLEAIGPAVRGASFVRPVQGSVACSPASTAAWLGESVPRAAHSPSVRYLEAIQGRYGGPVPVGAPVTVFERAWVLTALGTAGITVPLPDGLLASLHAAFGEFGAAVGPGLLPDADDTATALHALALLGSPRSADCLLHYRAGRHFQCFPAERTPSTSANAHVLQAFGACPVPDSRYARVISDLAAWLCDEQQPDGCWWDKWHASPYYATVCCATALIGCGEVTGRTTALAKAVAWVLDTQRADGSWGRWTGTYEETAYAVQILLRTCGPQPGGAIERAAARGCQFLLLTGGDEPHPPLWHDKDLYAPVRVVRAEGMAALHLGRELIPSAPRRSCTQVPRPRRPGRMR